jgi:2,4-dienoyl-CoA reductase-like NADH-dependent reductase (Old Yellow Enzyme family)
VRVPNRFVVPALTTNFAEHDGAVGDRLLEYLRQRFEGGFGLVITENIGVHPSGRVMPRMVMAHEDRFVDGLRRLAQEVRGSGGVLFGQLSHAGRQTRSTITGQSLVAASAIPCPLNREMPRALETEEIGGMEQAFVQAARRLAEAGFDGVEIHAAHGYLVGGFLSRYSNIRTDEYGGSLENRMRFLLNIVAGIKQAAGSGFPVSVRISAREFVDQGLDLPEARDIAKALAAAGVNALSVSVGVYESFNRLSMITGEQEGRWLELAGDLRREAAPMPVIGVGRIKRPEVAEAALAEGLIDLAAFGRASIADPGLPLKVRQGRSDDIDWCLGCNICLGRSSRPESICPVNPAVGRERDFQVQPSAHPTRINIMGSSFSALTAAWIAARRGHDVSIDPAGTPLGGMQYWRSRVPGQEEYGEVIVALERRARRAGVRFQSGEVADDAVVWRVRCYQPLNQDLLDAHPDATTVYQVLAALRVPEAGRRVLVHGADLASVEAAILMQSRGCRVRLLVPARDVGLDAHPGYREACRVLLAETGAEVFLESGAEISEQTMRWADALVIGHGSIARYDDQSAWTDFTAPGNGDRCLADAYEPGLMTRGIYAAADMVLEFGNEKSIGTTE